MTYLSDVERVSYGTGDGTVRNGNRVDNAAVGNRESRCVFTTRNDQIVIPAY